MNILIKKLLQKLLEKLFLDEKERFILGCIVLNAIIIFMQGSDIHFVALNVIDCVITFIFIFEMAVKIKYPSFKEYWSDNMAVKINDSSFKEYWSDNWNKLDFSIVMLSLPTIVLTFLPDTSLSSDNIGFFMTFRVLRVFKLIRTIEFFPDVEKIGRGFCNAVKATYAVLIGFFILIVISALLSCSLFKEIAPEYFSDPFNSIYSIFIMFTAFEFTSIADAVANGIASPILADLSRIFFASIFVIGAIMGMSLINSIFVDAMIDGGNDNADNEIGELKNKINSLERKIDMLLEDKKRE